MSQVLRQLAAYARKDDSGIVAIWTALLMIVFLGFAAIAVDISRWYVEVERVQKTVDAAALAGAVYMPASVEKAGIAADEIIKANGWDVTDLQNISVTKAPGDDGPSQYRVTMSSKVQNAFASVLGIATTKITRTALADYAPPLPMGSPCNLLGTEAMEGTVSKPQVGSSDCSTSTGDYWLNIAGANMNKARGDGFSAGWCTEPDDGTADKSKGIDHCTGTQPDGVANSGSVAGYGYNADYAKEGYVYILRNKDPGTVKLEGYDIGWVATGDHCSDYTITGVDPNNPPTNASVPTAAEAKKRYAKNDSAFCTGDSSQTAPEGDGSTVVTEVTVRGPGPNPWSPLKGPEICKLTLPGWDKNTAVAKLSSATGTTDLDHLLQRTYHNWATLTQSSGAYTTGIGCGGVGGFHAEADKDYSVQIRTIGGGGQNRYALRASSTAGNTNVSIFAQSRVSLYNNVPAGQSTFSVLRLDSSAHGRTLDIRFFDMGDADGKVTAEILQPDSARMNNGPSQPNSVWGDCTPNVPSSTGINASGCTVTTQKVSGKLPSGGRWMNFSIKIPSDYKCLDDENQATCWVTVRLNSTSNQSDTTTWAAGLDGAPVRLLP